MSAKIKRLFNLKTDCVLVGFDGTRWVDIMKGPFDVMLTSYYLTTPWKYFYVRLPNGGQYPNDYLKATKNERH